MNLRRSRLHLEALEFRDTPSAFGDMAVQAVVAPEPIPAPLCQPTDSSGTVWTGGAVPSDVICSTQPVDSTGNPLDNGSGASATTSGTQLIVVPTVVAPQPLPAPPGQGVGYSGAIWTAEALPGNVVCSTQPVDSTGNPLDNGAGGNGSAAGSPSTPIPVPITVPMFPPTSPIV